MRELAYVTAAVFDHVNFVAVANSLYGGERHANLGPQSGQDDLLAAGLFNGGHEVLIVPGVHGRTFDGLLIWENGANLRPEVSTERLGLNCRQHDRNAKHLG